MKTHRAYLIEDTRIPNSKIILPKGTIAIVQNILRFSDIVQARLPKNHPKYPSAYTILPKSKLVILTGLESKVELYKENLTKQFLI